MSGDELRARRERLKMTQEQLAKALGVAANTVARWERGERSIPPHLPLALSTVEMNKRVRRTASFEENARREAEIEDED